MDWVPRVQALRGGCVREAYWGHTEDRGLLWEGMDGAA